MFDTSEIQREARAVAAGDDAARRKAVNFLKDVTDADWTQVPADVVRALVQSLQAYLADEVTALPARRSAVTILERLGARAAPAVPQLVGLLGPKHPQSLREAAAAALGRIGPGAAAATGPLADLLTDGPNPLALAAVRALGAIGRPDEHVRAALLGLWQSRSNTQGQYVSVAMALRRLGIDEHTVVPYLTAALTTNTEPAVRTAAAEALGSCGKDEPDVVPALLRASLGDKDERVRVAAAACLERFRLPRGGAVGVCAAQLADSAHAETALRLRGEAALTALVEVLAHGKPAARERAARVLGRLGEAGRDAAPTLTKALRDADPAVRLAAAKSLWSVSKDAGPVTPVLVGLLAADWPPGDNPIEDRRRALQTVIEALRDIGPPAAGAARALAELTKDPNRMVSESARRALDDIAPAALKK